MSSDEAGWVGEYVVAPIVGAVAGYIAGHVAASKERERGARQEYINLVRALGVAAHRYWSRTGGSGADADIILDQITVLNSRTSEFHGRFSRRSWGASERSSKRAKLDERYGELWEAITLDPFNTISCAPDLVRAEQCRLAFEAVIRAAERY